jgi:pyridoxine 5-phosphate synthase
MRLCINIDHIATLRQARLEKQPDPVFAAYLCELAGADGIVCHLREDRRHIIDRDVKILKDTVTTKLDLEMAATDEMVKIACDIKPYMVTLVPEKRQELTTEGGLDLVATEFKVTPAIEKLRDAGIKTSVFIEPNTDSVDQALEMGADMIEIHTGKYGLLTEPLGIVAELEKIRQTAILAKELGIGVNAGHGLNYLNITAIANISEIDEVSIGHSIIAKAVFTGLENAVREMLTIIRRVRQ